MDDRRDDRDASGNTTPLHDADQESFMTTDHETIRKWAEDRDGRPTIVRGTRSREDGLLRIDFASGDESLEEVSWDDFFAIFDANDLIFLYQEETSAGDQSRFSRFITKETAGLEEAEAPLEEDTSEDETR